MGDQNLKVFIVLADGQTLDVADAITLIGHESKVELTVIVRNEIGDGSRIFVDTAQQQRRTAFFQTLTTRQKEVVRWVVTGYSSKRIGHELHIKAGVVSGHLTEIYKQLDKFEQTAPDSGSAIRRTRLIQFFGDYFTKSPLR